MRNLAECQAEVFRRGEVKIRRRQRRRQTAMLCVVLALCVGVILAVARAERDPLGPVQILNPGITGEQIQNGTEASTRFAGSVSVTGKALSLSHTDPETVERILDMVAELTAVASEQLQDYMAGDYGPVTESNADTGWTLRLTRPDGVTEEYRLWEKVLVDAVTKERYALSEEDWKALEETLGISSP